LGTAEKIDLLGYNPRSLKCATGYYL